MKQKSAFAAHDRSFRFGRVSESRIIMLPRRYIYLSTECAPHTTHTSGFRCHNEGTKKNYKNGEWVQFPFAACIFSRFDTIRHERSLCTQSTSSLGKNHFNFALFSRSALSLFFHCYYSGKYMAYKNYKQKASRKRCGKCGTMYQHRCERWTHLLKWSEKKSNLTD